MTVVPALWPALVPADTRFAAGDVAMGARGVRIEFADGSTRLCATSGLWNAPLGYGNPVIAEAIARAAHDASYLSLFRSAHRGAIDAAEALIDLCGADAYRRVVFSTGGGAANDAAMKLARQYWAQQQAPSRSIIVGLTGSYHGTMYGSHALSGDELFQGLYGLDRRSIRHVAHDDGGEGLEGLLRREGNRVAAVVVEPLLGTGGVPLSDAFVERLLGLREHYGFLIVADEVATGFGRTGPLFASRSWPAPPDLMVLSKALTNGTMGAAALIVGTRIASAFEQGRWMFVHGETQAGTPVCAAAILAALAEYRRIDVEPTVAALGTALSALVSRLAEDALIADHSGRGCFLACRLTTRQGAAPLDGAGVSALVTAIAEQGAVVHPGPSGFQLIPAYSYGHAELAELDVAVRRGIAQFRQEHP